MNEYYLHIDHLIYHKDYRVPTKEEVLYILKALSAAANDLGMCNGGTSIVCTEEDL